MADYRFERECRTPFSEAYLINANEEQVGRVDIHYTPSIVYATLCVGDKMSPDDIQDLIDVIDEELIMSADVARDDFIVTVYQGREVGVFSDEDFEEEEEE
jgi:hypothetical protein